MSTTEMTSSESFLSTQKNELFWKPEWKKIIDVGLALNLYGSPFIVAFGLFGNVCTFLLMSRPAFSRSSTSIYFRTLAVADIVILVNHIMFVWVDFTFELKHHYWNKSDIICKFRYIMFEWSHHVSAWILVSVTFERFLVTAIPLKSKTYCTRRNAKIVCTVITVGFAVFWTVTLYTAADATLGTCNIEATYGWIEKYGRWIFVIVYTYTTTPTLFILNSFLVYKLIQAGRIRSKMVAQDSGSYDQYRRMTLMAVTVSVTYFVLTLPTTTVNLLGKFLPATARSSYAAWILFAHNASLVMRVSNHSANFLLYLLSNRRIRAEFILMMRGKTSSPKASSKTMMTSRNIKMSSASNMSTTSTVSNTLNP